MSAIVLSWMLTYLLHSTLLLGGAWLAWKLLPSEALAIKETLWRTALLGGIVTASLQAGLAVEPGLGSWRLGVTEPGAAGSRVAVASSTAEEVLARAGAPASRQTTSMLPSSAPSRRGFIPAVDGSAGSPDENIAAGNTALTVWSRWGLTVWAVGAFAMIGWLAVSCLLLVGRLAGRRAIVAGPLHALLTRLRTTTRMTDVILSASARIGSPMAFVWRRREICLPERVASDMAAEQQELILAHELAHHARRDPVWLIAGRLIECVLFFQPLNRVAGRRLREIAEYRCDDWAVERTGRPITLARCLADVAEWNLRRGAPLPVPTLAVERRRLGRRVTRLLDRGYPFPAPRRPRWLASAVALILLLVVLVAPGVSNGHAPPPPDAPSVPDAPDVSVTAPAPPVPVVEIHPPSAVVAPSPPSVAVHVLPTPVLAPSPPSPPSPSPSPPAPPVDLGDGAWVLHDDPRPVPSWAPLAEADDLVAVISHEVEQLSQSLSGLLPAEEWSVVAHELARMVDTAPSPEVVAQLAAFSHELEELVERDPASEARIAELTRLLAEVAMPDPEAAARIARLNAELASVARVDPEATARIAALSRELAELTRAEAKARALYLSYAQKAGADHELSADEREELARLRAELETRTVAEREELARLREEVRREIDASRPDREEMVRLRKELRREIDATRPDVEVMARLRERLRSELGADREARERELQELRAEVERLREELRRMREDALP